MAKNEPGRGRRPAGVAAAALAALLISGAASGEVYRCTEGRRVLYTDRPCAAGAEPHELPPATVIGSDPRAAELARQYDEKVQRGRRERDASDAAWLEDYKAGAERRDRVRSAIMHKKVLKGMTAAEVRRTLGEPDRVSRSDAHGSAKESWTYVDDGKTTVVNFKNGEVSSTSGKRK